MANAKQGLVQSRRNMENFMDKSSAVLADKIKAFEMKYVKHFLQDKNKLESCKETVAELATR